AQRQGKPRMIRWIERRLEASILHQARRILVPTAAGIAAIRARHPALPSRKMELLPNGCDLAEFALAECPPGRMNEFVIACTTSMLSRHYRDIQPFLTALAQTCEEYPGMRSVTRVRLYGSDIYGEYGEYIRTH